MKRTLLVACLAGLVLPAAWGQYKLVGPDGSVTYTDRPPASTNARISVVGTGRSDLTTPDNTLPFELRQVTTRFPVTLYTSPECAPCDAGRQFLQQRGVPYAERRVTSDDDAAALERAVGGRTVPALTVGGQALRGLSQTDWAAYLDAAGYPRESRLPAGYRAPAARPLVERAALPAQAAAAAPPPPVEAPAAEPQTAPGGIKF